MSKRKDEMDIVTKAELTNAILFLAFILFIIGLAFVLK